MAWCTPRWHQRRTGRGRAERRVAASASDRPGGLSDLALDTSAEPPAVLLVCLLRVLAVHRLDVLPGRQRLRLGVAHRSQLEPGGGEQARPVGEQFGAEWQSSVRSARSSAAVGSRSNTRSLNPAWPPGTAPRAVPRAAAACRPRARRRRRRPPGRSRVEAGVGQRHLQHLAVPDINPGRRPGGGDQLAALTDLLTADVQYDDLAVDAGADAPGRLAGARQRSRPPGPPDLPRLQ